MHLLTMLDFIRATCKTPTRGYEQWKNLHRGYLNRL